MSEKFIIKTIVKDHTGPDRTFLNVGKLTKSFVNGQTDPLNKADADAFMQAFGNTLYKGRKAFSIEAIQPTKPEKPKPDKQGSA